MSHFIEISNASLIDEEIIDKLVFINSRKLKLTLDINELLPGYYIARLRDRDLEKAYIRSLIIQR
jgi:hypothetical protein